MKNIDIINKQIKTIKEQYKNGRIIWNKGLTKETDIRIKNKEEKRIKTITNSKLFKGKNHPKAKPIIQLTLEGKLVREYEYIQKVKEYDFNCGSVEKCINHKHITKFGDNVYGKNNEEKYIWLSKKEYIKGDL